MRPPGHQRVKTARKRTAASTRWLERQLNDPYVRRAKAEGYRSRAAYKLLELDERFSLLKGMRRVVDLGIAPGGWSQVVRKLAPGAAVVGIDLLPVDPIDGVTILEMDFLTDEAPARLRAAFGPSSVRPEPFDDAQESPDERHPAIEQEGRPSTGSGRTEGTLLVDLVLSDMAANTVGHPQTDHLRTMALVEAGAQFAGEVLRPGGAFVAKVLAGGADHALVAELKRMFATVKHAKPPASRKGSSEWYVIAQGFKGRPGEA